MRVIEITRPGGPEVLVPADRPAPVPGPGEVRIRVAAAGVNRPDVMQRKGDYPPPPGASDIPGLEVSGTVSDVGENVTAFSAGDRVCALVAGGGYAEYVCAPAGQCLPVPGDLTMVQAAAIPETFFTVWVNVFERGRLGKDESLLVHGGAGGIGTTAIMLASAMGARVFATAGGPEKCAACESLGAERAVDYRSEDFAEVIDALTEGKGVDVIMDVVAGDYVDRNIKLAAVGGRIVFVGLIGGYRATINCIPILTKRLTLTGSTLRPQSVAYKTRIADALAERVWPLVESGTVTPQVCKVFPLEAAADAHRALDDGTHIGKIVLEVG